MPRLLFQIFKFQFYYSCRLRFRIKNTKNTLPLVQDAQDNKYSAANKEIIFSKIENLGNILEKIGEVFLCNVEINSAPTYLNLENAVCLNLDISEKKPLQQLACKQLFLVS